MKQFGKALRKKCMLGCAKRETGLAVCASDSMFFPNQMLKLYSISS